MVQMAQVHNWGGEGWLQDEDVYHFIKSQLETQWWLPNIFLYPSCE